MVTYNLKEIMKVADTWELDSGRPMVWELVMEKFMLWEVLKLAVWEEPIRSNRSAEGAVEAVAGTGVACRPEKRSIPAGLTGWTGGTAGCEEGKAFQSPKSALSLDAGAEERQKSLMNCNSFNIA